MLRTFLRGLGTVVGLGFLGFTMLPTSTASACGTGGNCCIISLNGSPCVFDYPSTRTIFCDDRIIEIDVTCCDNVTLVIIASPQASQQNCDDAGDEGRCIPAGGVYDPTVTVCFADNLMALYNCDFDEFYFVEPNGGASATC